jgi:phage-related protein
LEPVADHDGGLGHIFYTTETGKRPVEELLDSLKSKEAQKILWTLKLIEKLDRITSQYFKKLTGSDEIWECRVRTQSNAIRILGLFVNGDTLVLTHGYAKKSRRTDAREIKVAEKYRSDYLTSKRRPT